MFLIVSLVILFVSLAVIGWVVSRKFVYLKKLAPDVLSGAAESQESFWAEFFPGLAARLRNVNLREHRVNFLAEFEKILRKLRLLSLKLDAATNNLIDRVRRSLAHHESVLTQEAAVKTEQEIAANGFNELVVTQNGRMPKNPKEEEQKLIIEIAKNPKNAQLYKKLGNIYMRTGEWHDAAESFKKVLEFEPEDDTTRNKLERAIKKVEKLPE